MIFSPGDWFDFDPWLGGQELRKGGQLLGSEVFEDREGQDWPDAELATDSLLVKLRRAPKISGEHPLRRQDMLDGSDLASRLPHLRDIEYEVVCIDIVDKCLPRHIKYASPHRIDSDWPDALAPRPCLQVVPREHLHLPEPHGKQQESNEYQNCAEECSSAHHLLIHGTCCLSIGALLSHRLRSFDMAGLSLSRLWRFHGDSWHQLFQNPDYQRHKD